MKKILFIGILALFIIPSVTFAYTTQDLASVYSALQNILKEIASLSKQNQVAQVSVPSNQTTISTVITRFSVGNGQVLVSSGVPLSPGLLRDTDLKNVKVLVGGVEQSIYIEALKGKHSDGSLMSVLIQFQYSLSNTTSVPASIVIGAARTTTDLPKPVDNRGLPDAVILPSNPAYLVSTNIVGPTLTATQTALVQGISGAQYDADFATFVEKLWTTSADLWTEDYYDRAQIYYAMWIRTGNPVYWNRATKQLLSYRRDYLEANSYGTSPHWSQVDGLGLHYLLTGDEQSRYAITRITQIFVYFRSTIGLGTKSSGDVENRIRARVIMAHLWAWRLADDKTTLGSELGTMISDVLGAQEIDGSYKFTFPAYCNQSLNYMDGMLNEALIQTYNYYKADPRIVTAVKKNIDWLWTTQWSPLTSVIPSGGFKYVPSACPNVGGTEIVSELNNLILNGYAWVFAITGDTTYKNHADEIFNASVARSFLYGSKQFNQQYTTSYRYFAWREGITTANPVVINPVLPSAPVVSLSASDLAVTNGYATTLSWSSTNATSCIASGGWTGAKAVSGTLTLFPNQTATYTLACSGSGGTDTKSISVSVNPALNPVDPVVLIPTVSVSVSPTTMTSPVAGKITWSSTNASSCTASGAGWSGPLPVSGTDTIRPTVTTTYTVTCGTASQSATVTVGTPTTEPQTAPVVTVSIYASPTSITAGSPVKLTWSSTNATSCSASGSSNWSGIIPLMGSETVYPTVTTTYAITCGSITQNVTVTVVQNPTNPTTYTLTKTLSRGSWGTQVTTLQTILKALGYLSSAPTGYFGSATESAVKAFQRAQGIVTSGTPRTTGYGATGPTTRAALLSAVGQ